MADLPREKMLGENHSSGAPAWFPADTYTMFVHPTQCLLVGYVVEPHQLLFEEDMDGKESAG